MTDQLTPEQERDALAAELALGVLEGEARTAALRLKLADPDFAAAVTAWERRFDPLYHAFEEQTPPDVWPALERRLGVPGANIVSLRRWRVTAIASGALAASLALALALVLRPVPASIEIVRAPAGMAVAQLEGEEKAVMVAANYDPVGGELRVRAIKLPEGDLSPELWVIPADGVPRSLGLVRRKGLSRINVPAQHRAMLEDGATLAITMEPRNGAPHRKPSTAPIAAGKISTI